MREACRAFYEADMLAGIVTTISYTDRTKQILSKLPSPVHRPFERELKRRDWIPEKIEGKPLNVEYHPYREAMRLLKGRLGMKMGQSAVDVVYNDLDHWVAKSPLLEQADAVYAYEDGALQTFRAAKKAGKLCLYDLPISYFKTGERIMREEAELFPEFATVMTAIHEPIEKQKKKIEEAGLADHIFVASTFTKNSLLEAGFSAAKVSVIPYGCPTYLSSQGEERRVPDKFRVLFVGQIGPRKGVHYLLQAWKSLNLKNAELVLVGSNQFPPGWLESQLDGTIRYEGIVPHHELGTLYKQASLFAFPSLVEGFGLVLLEAMACGVPILTTANTGGPDIITDGKEGYIVPIRDVSALKERIKHLCDYPHLADEMSSNAVFRRDELDWNTYRSGLAKGILGIATQ